VAAQLINPKTNKRVQKYYASFQWTYKLKLHTKLMKGHCIQHSTSRLLTQWGQRHEL